MYHKAIEESFSLISSIKRMFQLYLVALLELLWNKQQARIWDKLRLAWDWDKSEVSISGVWLYFNLVTTSNCNNLNCSKKSLQGCKYYKFIIIVYIYFYYINYIILQRYLYCINYIQLYSLHKL